MFKSFAIATVASVATAQYQYGAVQPGIYQGTEDFAHDMVWGHDHYEPGNVKRFDGHFAEIYGADDLAWGANGYSNPLPAKDDVHNWDDQGDAYVCHSCGGHGCTLCGGYGHFHRNSRFGHHGHSLQNGFGVGHWHTYLGPKNRSSYNKYGHGIGGRYSQRWTNGYGDKYGLDAGQRYGLQHRWGVYNGIGHGNASSKGSVMGYGIGTNAETQPIVPTRQGGYDDYDWQYADEDYYHDDDYYGDYYYDDDYYGDDEYHYDEPEQYYEEPEQYYEEPEQYYEEPEQYYEEPEYHYEEPEQYQPHQYVTEWASGYGNTYDPEWDNTTGRTSMYQKGWSLGHGNHSPWHQEIHRNDRGMTSTYRGRPHEYLVYHENFDFPV